MGEATAITPEIRRYLQDIIVFMRLERGVAGGISPYATTQFVALAKYVTPTWFSTYHKHLPCIGILLHYMDWTSSHLPLWLSLLERSTHTVSWSRLLKMREACNMVVISKQSSS